MAEYYGFFSQSATGIWQERQRTSFPARNKCALSDINVGRMYGAEQVGLWGAVFQGKISAPPLFFLSWAHAIGLIFRADGQETAALARRLSWLAQPLL